MCRNRYCDRTRYPNYVPWPDQPESSSSDDDHFVSIEDRFNWNYRMSLRKRINYLVEDDFSASDDYELNKFERFRWHNKRLIKKYEKACWESPSQFHRFDKWMVLLIVEYIGKPWDVLRFINSVRVLYHAYGNDPDLNEEMWQTVESNMDIPFRIE